MEGSARIKKYLPSTQFIYMFSALALSALLVLGADFVTKPKTHASVVAEAGGSAPQQDPNWEATLYDIQAQQGVGSLPPAPDQNTVNALLQSAQSENITDSVGRSLLVNITNAKGQGLGDDIPTQTQLVNQAAALLKKDTKPTYATSDLHIVPDSTSTTHAYANALMLTLAKNAADNKVYTTLYAVGYAADHQSDVEWKKLNTVEKSYRALVLALVKMPVPQTMAPFHLGVVNDFAQMADTYPDIESLITDPLRGLAALQRYRTLGDETDRLFINIAQSIQKSGILFGGNEPGRVWSGLVSL